MAAETGMRKGEAAVLEMINWSKAAIAMENPVTEKSREIHRPLMTILTDGLRLKEEKARFPGRTTATYRPGHELRRNKKPMVDPPVSETLSSPPPVTAKVEAEMEAAFDQETDKGPGTMEHEEPGRLVMPEEKTQGDPTALPGALKVEEKLSLTRLANFLIRSDGILGFRIYDEQDMLKAKYDKSGYCTKLKPGVFWNQSSEIKTVIGGGILKYLVISTKKGVKYAIIHYHRRRIVIAVQPGYKTSDLVKALV